MLGQLAKKPHHEVLNKYSTSLFIEKSNQKQNTKWVILPQIEQTGWG